MQVVYVTAARVLAKLGSIAYDEISFAWGLGSDLEKLQRTISTVKSVLLDAEEKQAHNRQVSAWLSDVRDVFLDADDVVDEFECEVLRRRAVNLRGNTGRKVRRFFSRSNPLLLRIVLGHKLKVITERLDEIEAGKAKFHLNDLHEEKRGISKRKRAIDEYSYIRAFEVIGREVDKINIISLLMEPCGNTNVSVIPICGIGGLGKTTLAKVVYNDKSVSRHFELKIWVCVSEDFELPRLIKEINSATGGVNADNSTNLDYAQNCLRNKLKDKRFLLILDDVWNDCPNKWFPLRDLLMDGSIKGSKIIVTTRKHSVAKLMGTVPSYNLRGLSSEDCLSLFIKWAFKEGEENQHQNLVHIGKQILEKCGGVPLAVTTLGSLLHSNLEEQDWKYIRDNEIWKLAQTEDHILPALQLSYNELPPYLKQCFHFCSLFPKDYTFNSEELIQLWMDNGLLQSHDGNKRLEDVGRLYFKELWSRSFFQDVKEIVISHYTFSMHDLIHDLALLMSQSEYSMIDSPRKSVSENVRHLSFTCHCNDIPTSLEKLKRVRTIIFPIKVQPSNASFVEKFTSKFKFLRVLHLRHSTFERMPSYIGSMKHLRSIDISFNKSIKKLPNSICKLQSLQTLKLFGCLNLEELPRDLNYLISLRYLEVTTTATCLPEINCLTSLERLEIFHCCNLISLPKTLRSLTALETLEIGYCKKLVLDDEEEDNQVSKLSLRRLTLRGLPEITALPQWLRGCEDSLELLLFNGCPNMRSLPQWLPNLASLGTLVIWGCPKLQSLPEGMRRLTSLHKLEILLCSELKNSLKEKREDWPPNVPFEDYI